MNSSDNRFNSRNWSSGSSRMPNNNRVFQAPLYGPAFPSGSSSHRRVIVVPGEMAHTLNPRLRQFIQNFTPALGEVNQWPMEPPPQQVESTITQEEQHRALKKLKKVIYNPPTKRKWCLYYRDTGGGIFNSKEEENDDSAKGCVICIEDFVPNTEVLATPCNHMFHEECIIPWVKSHGQCPICRAALSKPDRDGNYPVISNPNPPIYNNTTNSNTSANSHSNSYFPPDDISADDLISLLRSVEFERMAFTHY